MSPLIDHILHGGELLAFILLIWRATKFFNRIESVLRDYPPHKHVNGSIVYPTDFQPGKVERIAAGAGQ